MFFNRVWKGFCVIRDLAEIERVIWEYRKNPAVIREFYIGCDAGFSLPVVRDSWFPWTKFREFRASKTHCLGKTMGKPNPCGT